MEFPYPIGMGGSYAEYMILGKQSLIVPIPDEMSLIEGAAFPILGNTMIKVLKDLELKPSDTLFIAGASGSNGRFAIQPNTSVSSMKVVKDGGKVISVSGDQFTTERNIKSVYCPYNMDIREELIGLMNKIVLKEIKLTIEKIYDFKDGLSALKKVGKKRARGKTIIEIN